MNKVVKILLGLLLAAAVVLLLFEVVFPWVDRTLITDPTLDAQSARVVALAR